MSEAWDVIVVGAGPAGASAAIQLRRCGVEVLVLEARRIGGLLHEANLLENYLGAGEAVSGAVLAARIEAQMAAFGPPVRHERVVRLERLGTATGCSSIETHPWQAVTDAGCYRAKSVVAASGTVSIPLTGVSVSPEAACRVLDEIGPLLGEQKRRIGIVGAGDAAFDYALNLAQRGNWVVILSRSGRERALRLLVQRASASEAIEHRLGVTLREIRGSTDGVEVVMERDGLTARENFHYVLLAIGRVPAVGYLPEGWEMLAAQAAETGLYCVGDMVNNRYRQAAIAAGAGLWAAMAVYERLSGQ